MRIVLSGATGFIGRILVRRLREKGHDLVILTRHAEGKKEDGIVFAGWDGRSSGEWEAFVDGAEAVINLAGEGIASRKWTPEFKKKIIESRLQPLEALRKAVEASRRKPRTFISASAVGYYGNVPFGDVTEKTPSGEGFLAETCRRWEEAALALQTSGCRVVLARTGVVLGRGGGALDKMIPPFRFFVGGPLGSGRQWLPWIHIEDAAGLMIHALDHAELSGALNVTAPAPATMKEFCKALGRVLKRPCWAPVPAFILKGLLGEMAEEMLLHGQRAVPEKALASGYVFRFPDLEDALRNLLRAT